MKTRRELSGDRGARCAPVGRLLSTRWACPIDGRDQGAHTYTVGVCTEPCPGRLHTNNVRLAIHQRRRSLAKATDDVARQVVPQRRGGRRVVCPRGASVRFDQDEAADGRQGGVYGSDGCGEADVGQGWSQGVSRSERAGEASENRSGRGAKQRWRASVERSEDHDERSENQCLVERYRRFVARATKRSEDRRAAGQDICERAKGRRETRYPSSATSSQALQARIRR